LKILDNNVEAMTSGSLALALGMMPWSNNQQALFNSQFLSQKFGKPTNYPRGGYIFKTFFLQWEKIFKSTSQKLFLLC